MGDSSLESQVELTEKKTTKTNFLLKLTTMSAINQGFNARKCSASGKLIGAKDHASIQLNVAEVDESGRMTGSNVTYAICGNLRKMGESDDAINRLAKQDGLIKQGVF